MESLTFHVKKIGNHSVSNWVTCRLRGCIKVNEMLDISEVKWTELVIGCGRRKGVNI